MSAAVALVALALAGPVIAQGAEPLRKTQLISLLTGGTMTPPQIAALVRRNCVSFTPTQRDRQNLIALGADSAILAGIDACVRTRARKDSLAVALKDSLTVAAARPPRAPPSPAPVPAALVAVPLTTRSSAATGDMASVGVALKRGSQAVAGARLVLRGTGRLSGGADVEAVTDERGIALFRFAAGGPPGTLRLAVATAAGEPLAAPAEIEFTTVAPAPPPPPPAPRPATARTGFVLGMGQRGTVGEAAPLPVVFEVRDSAGTALAGVPVTLAVTNGRLIGAAGETDSLGQVRAQVVLGERAGVPTVVTGTVDAIVREATLYPSAGRAARLVVLLDGNALAGQVVLLSGQPAQLRIFCLDPFGNSVPLSGLRVTVGDDRVVRVTGIAADSLGGSIAVMPGRAGSTNLVVQGSGLRADFSAQVRH